jgi:hypothetical protein
MGSLTQLGLCPPGRGRRELKSALRQKNTRSGRGVQALQRRNTTGGLQGFPDMGGYYGVDKLVGPDVLEIYAAQEDAFLDSNGIQKNSSNSFKVYDDESEEEASSGDDDDLTELKYLLLIDEPLRSAREDEKKYGAFLEPLFTPVGAEIHNNAGVAGGNMSIGGAVTGKLPFNRRKLRYFDSIIAQDTMIARTYLQKELEQSKKREILLLSKQVKHSQQIQRSRVNKRRGQPLQTKEPASPETIEESSPALRASVSTINGLMTPALAAAMVLESLELNPLESIEGMSNCYEGIVAAGVALQETNVSDPISPANDTVATHATRAEIIGALTPLLISSLEQPSGDVIIMLAKMRRMCGTPRYERRFVQRIAPSLIRPPRGSMWCLKHQNDMEPILAAAELIFDSAFAIFSKGWYDRGQLLLADTKRAETLSAAAIQLKNLSAASHENLTLELGHSGWRSYKYKSGKDSAKGTKEPLAEWEVIAVDRQIRISISSIISMDWTKVVVHSREAALSTASYHRNRQPNKRSNVILQATTSGDMSPKNSVASSPVSPARQYTTKNAQVSATGTGDLESSPHSSFLPPKDPPRERSRSPIPTSTSTTTPISPPLPNRTDADDASQSSHIFPTSELTPPRSPNPKPREYGAETTASTIGSSPPSPKRGKVVNGTFTSPHVKESISNIPDAMVSAETPHSGGDTERTLISPLSVGTTTSVESVPHRPISSTASVASSVTGLTGIAGAQPSHYRMLTSTAAERKRTVAACRALRAQITRFEEAFIALHGRPPKGATERAPLATTYAQYREWKRAIRADAACRIQALCRGAITRSKLLIGNDPLAVRVVMSRAGRRSSAQHLGSAQPTGQDAILNELIPTEISGNQPDTTILSGDMDQLYTSDGHLSSQARFSQWGSHVVRRRPISGSEGFASTNHIPKPVASPSSSVSSKVSSDLVNLSLPELQGRKRELKQQLKQYDMNFAKNHGRMPVKAEKEPIRHLYEKYNALKSKITLMEQEGKGVASPPAIPQSSPATLTQRTVSPVGSDSEESGPRRSHARVNRAPSSMTGQTTSQDLSTLKAEKGRLHQMLRSYEKDFYREHQRQVSSFADIRPVASQYRRYKEIKKAITALQSSGERRER